MCLKNYLVFLIIGFYIIACNPEEKRYTSIIFEEEFQEDSVRVYYFDLLSQKQIPIPKISNESLKNEIRFDLQTATFANFEYQDSTYNIYLEPGFKLRYSFLKDTELNPQNEAEQYHHEFRKMQKMFFDREKPFFFRMTFDDFRKRQTELRESYQILQKEIENKEIAALMNGFFETRMAWQQLNYTLGNYDVYEEPNEETLWLLDDKDFKISNLQFERNNLEGNFVVQMYIDAIVYPELSRQGVSDSSTKNNLPQAIELINKSNVHQSMKEWLIAQSIYMKIYAVGLDSTNIVALENFQSEYKEPQFIRSLQKLKAETETLNPGAVVPNLKGRKQDSTEIALHDLKGKLIYLDVWATWCQPCLKEIPHSKLLEERFKNENIEFVYLSVDRDKEKWNHFLDNSELKGIHLSANNITRVYKELRLYGIPQYVLIDENSKIIDAYAPRPSDEEIYNLIAQNLQ
jgi:thiol-disulfide isomerase/thioredoxin